MQNFGRYIPRIFESLRTVWVRKSAHTWAWAQRLCGRRRHWSEARADTMRSLSDSVCHATAPTYNAWLVHFKIVFSRFLSND